MQTLLLNLFTDKLVQAFCWMLVHSLWLGAIFTVLTGIVLMTTTRSKAAVRYDLVAGLFFAFVAACGAAFVWEFQRGARAFLAGDDEEVGRIGRSPLL